MNLQGDTSDVYTPIDFSKIRVGLKTLQDATIDIGSYRRINPRCGDKDFVLTAINNGNIDAMREISNFFYKTYLLHPLPQNFLECYCKLGYQRLH